MLLHGRCPSHGLYFQLGDKRRAEVNEEIMDD
jgi:hypothetical protein